MKKKNIKTLIQVEYFQNYFLKVILQFNQSTIKTLIEQY